MNKEKGYVIGIEGGGTKSVIAADSQGKVFYLQDFGALNIHSISKEALMTNLSGAFHQFAQESQRALSDCMGVCIGAAGIDTEDDRLDMQSMLNQVDLSCASLVVNDAEIAIKAGLGDQKGILIIAGTGSIALAKSEYGEITRCGGWDYLVGDEGSGFWIASEAIRQSLSQYDETGLYSELLRQLVEKTGDQGVDGLMNYVYQAPFNKKRIASLARVVSQLDEEGDLDAGQVIQKASEELSDLAVKMIRKMKWESEPFTILIHGSVLTKNQRIRETFQAKIESMYSQATVKILEVEASMGAIQYALQLK